MSDNASIFIQGWGAVSPAGWGLRPFREAVWRGEPLPDTALPRPGWEKPLAVRRVPAPAVRPAFLAHARLRRTSPITQYAVAAALEALGEDAAKVSAAQLKLGIVLCVMSGCVNYSRRFYDEALREPATASPLIFPETVFNAPASHLAALLGSPAVNYTLVGDPGTFLQGLALAADWLTDGVVDGCLVVGAEETDWLTADAFRLFDRRLVLGDGAGALYLRRTPAAVKLAAITDPQLFLRGQSRLKAARQVQSQLPPGDAKELLCDGTQAISRLDAAENSAWINWPGTRLSPKSVLGEGLMAAAAWQCVAACDALRERKCSAANVSVIGVNQQAIGARFVRATV